MGKLHCIGFASAAASRLTAAPSALPGALPGALPSALIIAAGVAALLAPAGPAAAQAAQTAQAAEAAQPAQALPAELLACRDISAADERLACYDRAVRRHAGERPPQASGPRPPAAETPPASARAPTPDAGRRGADPGGGAETAPLPSPAELFGRDPADIQRRMDQAAGREELQQITGEVVELIEIAPDRIAVKLDNGQIWRQTDPARFFLREGHAVEIRRATLGSYMMSRTGSSRSVRVERAD